MNPSQTTFTREPGQYRTGRGTIISLMIWYDEFILMVKDSNSDEMLTTIKLDSKTRDRLVELGKKKESYDTILNRLVDHWENTPPKQ